MKGVIVRHKLWGEGTVIEQTDSTIKVRFSNGREPGFVIPDAFDGFLTTDDAKLLKQVAKQKAIKEAEKQRAIASVKKTEPVKPIKKEKRVRKVERANVAFKCNYCDGGKTATCIGYKGVCSDEMIHYNIEKAKHVWCGSDSPCRKYLEGEITRAELDNQFVCYESTMLTEWKASAGVVQNGENKGKPMKLLKVQNNSLCVLTTRLPNMTEADRFIFAVFLVDESYEGDGRDEGYVTNHSKWRIELKQKEAQKLLFWNYYWNANAPTKVAFGTGLFRYFGDIQAAQILRDIVNAKRKGKEKEFAQEFLQHYCALVGLDENDIPPCAGALKR